MKASEETGVAVEVRRVAAALRTAIRLSGVSHRHVERSLYMSTGYLTRILGGEVELRVRHVLQICEVIDFPVGNFLGALFPAEPPESVEEARLTRGLASLHSEPLPPRQARDPEAVLADLHKFIDQLRDLLEIEDS